VDAKSSLGDAKGSLGDTKSSLGDANISLGDVSLQYEKVFQPRDDQPTVFAEISALITSVMDGYNVTIFAYGQVCSRSPGKPPSLCLPLPTVLPHCVSHFVSYCVSPSLPPGTARVKRTLTSEKGNCGLG
jgi:hypothetical protein